MSELCGSGWTVASSPDWEDGHCAFWRRPEADDVDQAYEAAWRARENGEMPVLQKAARDFALQFDVDRVFQVHMVPVLEAIAERVS